MNAANALQRALALHQQGKLLEAGEIYRDILAKDPDQVDALSLMGVVMQAAGDLETAEALLSRATELAPDYFAPFANLGNVLQAAGRVDAAIDAFRHALELNPKSVETANNLASAMNEVGRFDAALKASERALSLLPRFPEALVNKGNALLGLGQAEEAVAAYRKALKLAPGHGNALFNLGNALVDLERFEDAIEPYSKAVAQDQGNAEKHFNLANALMKADRLDQCLAPFETALALKPGYVDALCNFASALQALGRSADAVKLMQKALAFQPESPDLHWNLALAALQNGDYATGWSEYEWRWQTPTFADFRREFAKPEWDGSALDGRTILVHTEQGFGDNLQFCRFVPMAAAAGGKVVLECRPQLQRLFETLDGVETCIALGDAPPPFEVHAPLMSLPRIFGTTLETIPATIPYLAVPDGVAADPRIAAADGIKIGLAWAGSPTRVDNHKRSVAFRDLVPLIGIDGISLFSLQVGDASEQLAGLNEPPAVTDLSLVFKDFADTAAAVAALDLVISVDTSVLHLAGALGKPAWGLMSQPTGFLWMDARTDSPWYPSIRLYRQPTPGDWSTVVAEVVADLTDVVAAGGAAALNRPR
jgi:tetratricopeptide (TPR) repeat protein